MPSPGAVDPTVAFVCQGGFRDQMHAAEREMFRKVALLGEKRGGDVLKDERPFDQPMTFLLVRLLGDNYTHDDAFGFANEALSSLAIDLKELAWLAHDALGETDSPIPGKLFRLWNRAEAAHEIARRWDDAETEARWEKERGAEAGQ